MEEPKELTGYRRYKMKAERKLSYLSKFGIFFRNQELLSTLKRLDQEVKNCEFEPNHELKSFGMRSANTKLKIVKKQYENGYFNQLSNVRAFHLKAALKNIPLIRLYDKLFVILEYRAKIKDPFDINIKVENFCILMAVEY